MQLVRVSSVTGTDAESALQHDRATRLAEWGFDVDAWRLDLAELEAHPELPGTEAPRSEGYFLVGTISEGTPALVLQGHVDVVPTGDLDRWHDHDPFSGRIVDGVLRRPPSCRRLRDRARGDAAVLTEPTSGRIVTANAGVLTFEIRVAGRAAHGSTRLEGVSAFDAFLPINAALAELERERNAVPEPLFLDTSLPYPISIGRVTADARAALERAVAAACAADPWLRDHPATVSWSGGQFASGSIDSAHPLIDEVTA